MYSSTLSHTVKFSKEKKCYSSSSVDRPLMKAKEASINFESQNHSYLLVENHII